MATARKTSSSRSTAKKAAPRSSDDSAETSTSDSGSTPTKKASTPRKRAPRAEAPRRKGGQQIAGQAAQQLLELTGKDPEGISGLRRTDDGWMVEVEVVELRRIPNTTDVLATYEVQVDADGELLEYRRAHRYVRGVPGEDGR